MSVVSFGVEFVQIANVFRKTSHVENPLDVVFCQLKATTTTVVEKKIVNFNIEIVQIFLENWSYNLQ